MPLDIFRLTSVIDAIPAEWRGSLTTSAPIVGNEPFNLHDEIKLSFNGKSVLLETVVSKTVYKELRNRIITPPTAQLNFNTLFINDDLECKEIYSLPQFRTSLDTKSREFQDKLLNRCLVTNCFLSFPTWKQKWRAERSSQRTSKQGNVIGDRSGLCENETGSLR